jgi:hypothetical protein
MMNSFHGCCAAHAVAVQMRPRKSPIKESTAGAPEGKRAEETVKQQSCSNLPG